MKTPFETSPITLPRTLLNDIQAGRLDVLGEWPPDAWAAVINLVVSSVGPEGSAHAIQPTPILYRWLAEAVALTCLWRTRNSDRFDVGAVYLTQDRKLALAALAPEHVARAAAMMAETQYIAEDDVLASRAWVTVLDAMHTMCRVPIELSNLAALRRLRRAILDQDVTAWNEALASLPRMAPSQWAEGEQDAWLDVCTTISGCGLPASWWPAWHHACTSLLWWDFVGNLAQVERLVEALGVTDPARIRTLTLANGSKFSPVLSVIDSLKHIQREQAGDHLQDVVDWMRRHSEIRKPLLRPIMRWPLVSDGKIIALTNGIFQRMHERTRRMDWVSVMSTPILRMLDHVEPLRRYLKNDKQRGDFLYVTLLHTRDPETWLFLQAHDICRDLWAARESDGIIINTYLLTDIDTHVAGWPTEAILAFLEFAPEPARERLPQTVATLAARRARLSLARHT